MHNVNVLYKNGTACVHGSPSGMIVHWEKWE